MFNIFKKIRKNKIEKLIVGLGNPTPKYFNTRHNAGFEAVLKIAKENNIEINKRKFNSLFGFGYVENVKCALVLPQTYMNNSGEAVEDFKNYYKLEISDIIVLVDDINFPPGKIKIKKKGSDGGHNGVKSVIYCTGEENFVRIKIGVGQKPKTYPDLADWVLKKFTEEELEKMNLAYEETCKAVSYIVNEKVEKAMNCFN